jgi:uncharacterized membrane protein
MRGAGRSSRGFGIPTVLGAFAIGGATTYLFDVDHGRRRRGRMRDLAVHMVREVQDAVGKGARDLSHRAAGGFAELARTFDQRDAHLDDEVLAARVRSAIGRACSHPHAIDVRVEDGCVTLRGPILAGEADEVCRLAAHVRGVRTVDGSGLERHTTAERVSALQGASRMNRRGGARARHEWRPASRLIGGAAGASLLLSGLGRGGLLGRALAIGGGALLVRAAVNVPLSRLVGLGKAPAPVELRKTFFVEAPVEDVFSFFTRVENFPRFMQHVRQVKPLPDGRSHWVVEGPVGIPVQWDAEITRMVQNEVFAWKTSEGSPIRHAGIARFERANHGTRVDMRVTYQPVAGVVGHAVATLLGANPKRALDEDMLRFKSLIERGKTVAHGVEVTRQELQP